MRKLLGGAITSLLSTGVVLADYSATSRPSTQPAFAVPQGWQAFGEPMRLDAGTTVSVEAVLKDPKSFDGKALRLTGIINKVCVPKGCWMQFNAPGSQMPVFVKFTCPIDGRLIPMEAVGKEAVVEGVLEIVEISEAAAKHYLEDEGAYPEEVAHIVGPQKQLRVKGPSALVKNE